MFIHSLSLSLGGLRIDPATLYSPGVSIRSLAKVLLERLEREDPALKRKIIMGETGEAATDDVDIEAGLHSVSDSDEESNEPTLTESESSFDESLVSNVRLLQGMRGVFTFMVLWDHFHHPLPISTTFTGDVSFFVMLSGFTTSLQLREPPMFDVVNGTHVLRPRSPFNWKKFLFTRFIGIYPILYLALLLNAPFWYLQDSSPGTANYLGHIPGLNQNRRAATCTFLYVIGMQSWYRPACAASGPNSVLYASIIINCFIFYCVVRYWLQYLQERYIATRGRSLVVPFSRQEEAVLLQNIQDSAEKREIVCSKRAKMEISLSDAVALLSYNRPHNMKLLVGYSLSWLVVLSVVFSVISVVGSLGKNALIYIPYFFLGVVAACLTEMWHYILWRPTSAAYVPLIGSKRVFPTLSVSSLIRGYPFNGTMAAEQGNNGLFSRCAALTWRFVPDMLSITCGFLMSTVGGLSSFKGKYFLQWLVVPYLLTAYAVIALLQQGAARRNLSRAFLESSLMNYLGYISYTMYLFQAVILTWYAPTISRSASSHTNFFIREGNLGDAQWFLNLHPGWRILAICILSFFCWFVQKYYQDTFVLWLYHKLADKTAAWRRP
jgi:hypothetical protein